MMDRDSSYKSVVDIVQQLNTFDYYRDFPTTIPNSLTHRGIDSQYDSFMQSLPIRQPEDGHLATGSSRLLFDPKKTTKVRSTKSVMPENVPTKGYPATFLELSHPDGKVKLCHNRRCGTDYDGGCSGQDAQVVVCRQLTFPESGPCVQYTPLCLDSVKCIASVHSRLTDCSANPIGVHSCAHSEESVCESKVKLCHNRRCGTDYDGGCGGQDARVVICGQFPESGSCVQYGPICRDSVNCNDNVHSSLTDCSASVLFIGLSDNSVETKTVPTGNAATSPKQLCLPEDKNNWASLTAAVGVSATGLMSLIYYFISLLLLIFVILIMIMVIFVFCHKKKQN